MKLLRLIVLAIVIFTADCHGFPDGPENINSAEGTQNLLVKSVAETQYSTDGPKTDSIEDDQQPEEISLSESEGPQSLELAKIEQQLEKQEQRQSERILRRSRCKARNACVVMGGFCVTNATLCEARLVPEGCKGTNCQCCVPATFETQMQNLETELRSMIVNLTHTNSNLDSKLDSANSDIKTELQFIKENLTNANSNQDSNLNFISDHQATLETKMQNLETELRSMVVNLTHTNSNLDSKLDSANSNIETELQFIKENLTNANSDQDSKLNLIINRQGCPSGFFSISSQCYKFFTDTTRSWTAAKAKCQTEGLVMAMPSDVLTLRKYLVETYGSSSYAWLGARGAGSSFNWNRNGQHISNSNSLWYPGLPGSSLSSSSCLTVLSLGSYLKNHPDTPYFVEGCNAGLKTLCELV